MPNSSSDVATKLICVKKPVQPVYRVRRAMGQFKVWMAFAVIALISFASISIAPDYAVAAKKKSKEQIEQERLEAEKLAQEEEAKKIAEIKEKLAPLSDTLNELLKKKESKTLFSPEDAGKLAEVKYQLIDMIIENPDTSLIAKPAYQAGVLYAFREEFTDAYEVFSFLNSRFPREPYGVKARIRIAEMKKKMGEDYFPQELMDAYQEDTTTSSDKTDEKTALDDEAQAEKTSKKGKK